MQSGSNLKFKSRRALSEIEGNYIQILLIIDQKQIGKIHRNRLTHEKKWFKKLG